MIDRTEAAKVLTIRQLQIWELHQNGISIREISYRLDVSRTTIADTLDAASRKLRANGVVFRPDGSAYLEEPE